MKKVNFLDINLDLETGTFRPYMKNNDIPVYVHHESNHPPGILKNIPYSVNKRLSSISSNQQIFEAACPPYQEALEKSGYNFKLKYDPPSRSGSKDVRKRNITYFNPPYSRNVQTNIGKIFLKSIDRCFPKNHTLRKIINRNTVKISYSCMPNFKQKISNHNNKIKNKQETVEPDEMCNCSVIIWALAGELLSEICHL